MPRVLMIGLDGFEISLAESMMADGLMPRMKALRDRSATFRLDHGEAKYSGLAWEHVSTGLAPEDGGRHAAVAFDKATYAVTQPTTDLRPFIADLPVRTVAFDVPYCDLSRSENTLGISCWGAHDPGVPTQSYPPELLDELNTRLGPYPATEWIYGMTWHSVQKTNAAVDALERGVRVRAEAAKWLLAERLPDWDLGIVVVSEPHSAAEPLWHGVDPSHRLHGLDSAQPSGDGLRRIFSAVDDLIGELADAFPDAVVMTFAMHGMGRNEADIPAMVLLPELLYRHAFDRPYMREREWAEVLPGGEPLLAESEGWQSAMRKIVPMPERRRKGLRARLGAFSPALASLLGAAGSPPKPQLSWIPAARYGPFWTKMPAFALPSYYDARVRINLEGREEHGTVPLSEYESVRRDIERLIRACRDPTTDAEVIEAVQPTDTSPEALGPWEADLYVRFKSQPVALAHPRHGQIGPVPYRRTGGHTGAWGFLYVAGEGIPAAEHGSTSAFDVVPTAVDLLGVTHPARLSGQSLAASLADADG